VASNGAAAVAIVQEYPDDAAFLSHCRPHNATMEQKGRRQSRLLRQPSTRFAPLLATLMR